MVIENLRTKKRKSVTDDEWAQYKTAGLDKKFVVVKNAVEPKAAEPFIPAELRSRTQETPAPAVENKDEKPKAKATRSKKSDTPK